jgi:hypothetical protein
METLRGVHYEFDTDKYQARYWNANGYGCAVVASVTPGVDWSAYIGGCDPLSEDAGCRFVASHGVKLTEADARHFFPDFDLPYRR